MPQDNDIHAQFDIKFAEWLDARIEKKTEPVVTEAINKIKLWIFAGLASIAVANFVPVVYFIYEFGQFRGAIEQRLGKEGWTEDQHNAYAEEINRRLVETNERITRNHPVQTAQ